MVRRHSLVWARSLALLVGLALLACGGDSGPGPTAPNPPPASSITFTPDQAPSAGSFALVRGSGTGGTLLELELRATDVPPVRSVDLILTYPTDLLTFEDLQLGAFLGSDATLTVTGGNGTLSVLTSRNSAGTAQGSGVHSVIRFRGAADGTGRIEIFDPEARDGDDLVVEDLLWVGGEVTVDL